MFEGQSQNQAQSNYANMSHPARPKSLIEPTDEETPEKFRSDNMNTNTIGLSTLEDICQIILHSNDLNATLVNIAKLVSKRMETEVCSIYLGDRNSDTQNTDLILRASVGLSHQSIGEARLQIGEGLVGYTAETGSVINTQEPQSHPRFRYIAGSNEEQFHSFLGIPLYNRTDLLGVMAIQTIESRQFTPQEVSTLRTIAFQLSSVIANARLLENLHQLETDQPEITGAPQSVSKQTFLVGKGIAPGACTASAFIFRQTLGTSHGQPRTSAPIDSNLEKKKLWSAIEQAKIDTLCLQKLVTDRISQSDADIFQAHLMILQDKQFWQKLENQITNGKCASEALQIVVDDYTHAFEKMEDPFLRSRMLDIEDVGRRVHQALHGVDHSELRFDSPVIIVAKDLLPSQLATLPFEHVQGLVMESDHTNSHATIIAKSMGIPTIVGVRNATRFIKPSDHLILDTASHRVYVNPDDNIQAEYARLLHEQKVEKDSLSELCLKPACTSDGHRISLRANLGLISDLDVAKRYGAEGIGLYRTEFPFMSRTDFPNRDEQFSLYQRVIQTFPDQSVTFRTLDIGGDKSLPYFQGPKEENPFLGWRSVRISLDQPALFQTQIEAVLMASAAASSRLMFPMITTVDEFHSCLRIVDQAKQQLSKENISFGDVQIGVMVEVPATVAIARHLAKEAQFFALGTNDLIQYTLAADRGNSLISRYYDPLHPAVLKAIDDMIQVTSSTGRSLSICGEMAGDFETFALLVGMGLTDFSVTSPSISHLKLRLRNYRINHLKSLAAAAIELPDSDSIRQLITSELAAKNEPRLK